MMELSHIRYQIRNENYNGFFSLELEMYALQYSSNYPGQGTVHFFFTWHLLNNDKKTSFKKITMKE